MASFAQLNASSEDLPASIQAETSVLGAMQLTAEALSEATLALTADDFSLDSHRRIFDVLIYLSEENVNVEYTTILDELKKRKELDAVGGPAYLAFLTEGIPRHFSISAYVGILKEKRLLRELLKTCYDGFIHASDQSVKAVDIIRQIEERMSGLSEQTIVGKFSSAAEVIQSHESLDAFLTGAETRGTIATGFRLDKWTNLLKPGQLIIIAGRPSMGKTALALNIAANSSIRFKHRVGIFSLEMEKDALIRRIIQSESHIPKHRFEVGLTREERDRAHHAVESLLEAPLYIEDTAFTTLQDIRAKARKLQREKGLDLLIIDYLGLMEPPAKSENRTQEVSVMSRGLKGLAKELGIPVIALAQLNRKCEERADKRPLLSDLRDSGSIEQDADIVGFVYREEVYDPKNPEVRNLAELNIAKHRDGRTGCLEMTYIGDYTRFDDRAYSNEEDYHHAA